MDNKKSVCRLIEFIIDQEMDLHDYPKLVPMIKERFLIYKRGQGTEHFENELIDDIISWEKGNQYDSLEKTIGDKFVVIVNP